MAISIVTTRAIFQGQQSFIRALSCTTNLLKISNKSSGTQTGRSTVESATQTSPEPNVPAEDKYNVPEYFGHNPMTYYEFEVAMRPHRIKQPDANRK